MAHLRKTIKVTYIDHPASFRVRPGYVIVFQDGRHYKVVEVVSSTKCLVERYRDFFRMLIFFVEECWNKIKRAYGLK